MPDPELVLRSALPTDENFIRRTWLSGLRSEPNGLPDRFWWPAHRSYVEEALTSPDFRILIAGASDDPHEILGYAVAGAEVLEWVHIRNGLRGKGLAGVLLRALGFSREAPPQARWRTQFSRGRLVLLHRPMELRK